MKKLLAILALFVIGVQAEACGVAVASFVPGYVQPAFFQASFVQQVAVAPAVIQPVIVQQQVVTQAVAVPAVQTLAVQSYASPLVVVNPFVIRSRAFVVHDSVAVARVRAVGVRSRVAVIGRRGAFVRVGRFGGRFRR